MSQYACGIEMPRYRCHKEVWALKVGEIIQVQEPTFQGAVCRGCVQFGSACGHCERCRWREEHSDPGYVIVPEDQRYARFCVQKSWVLKHKPVTGGYYVVYKDGYSSFSPQAAFEEGYAPIA